MRKMFLMLALALSSNQVFANDWDMLAKDGYAAIAKTKLSNRTFDGCEYDKVYQLDIGLYFKCTRYKYLYRYNPDVYILKHATHDSYKVVIADKEFQGVLLR